MRPNKTFVGDTESQDSENYTCRICYASEHSASRLISPCMCSGSVQYAHEECLKEWLLSKSSGTIDRKCEICKHSYEIESKWKAHFNIKTFFKVNASRCTFLSVILGLLIFFTVIISYLQRQDQLFSSGNGLSNVVFIIGCCIAFALLFCIMICTLKGFKLFQKKCDWKIKNLKKSQGNKIVPISQDYIKTDYLEEVLKINHSKNTEKIKNLKQDAVNFNSESATYRWKTFDLLDGSQPGLNSRSLEIFRVNQLA